MRLAKLEAEPLKTDTHISDGLWLADEMAETDQADFLFLALLDEFFVYATQKPNYQNNWETYDYICELTITDLRLHFRSFSLRETRSKFECNEKLKCEIINSPAKGTPTTAPNPIKNISRPKTRPNRFKPNKSTQIKGISEPVTPSVNPYNAHKIA
uniref:Uncharacterized protein n=1 Tax=Romanomermis culicivorax TaxID=13658 RepID=A0A915KFZ1_ROMCU